MQGSNGWLSWPWKLLTCPKTHISLEIPSVKFECKLCLTQHKTESNYLAHTQGLRHQRNIRRRELQNGESTNNSEANLAAQQAEKKVKIPRIGQPGYRVSKGKDPNTGQKYLYFEIDYPMINEKLQPRYRFMSAYEQKIDLPPNPQYQYLLFAAALRNYWF